MIGKSFMVTVLACTFVGAFVGSLLADEPKFQPPPAANVPPPPKILPWQSKEELLKNGHTLLEEAAESLPLEAERIAVPQILVDLRSRTYDEILVLTLSSNICQEIACRGAPVDTVSRFVERYLSIRIADDNHAIAEESKWIAFGSLILSVIALVVSIATFLRKPKPTTPPARSTRS